MDEDTTGTETCEIVDRDVAVERTAEYGERGVIVTLDVESRGSEPTSFTLIDEFPDGLPVSDIGFRSGDEPSGGDIGPDGATVKGFLGPGEELTVVYAMMFFEPTPEVDLGEPELLVGEAARTGSGALVRGGTTSPAPSAPRSGAGSTAPESECESADSDADDGKTIGATLGLFEGDRESTREGRMTDGGPGTSRPTADLDFDLGDAPDAGSVSPDGDRATDESGERPGTSNGTEGPVTPIEGEPGSVDAEVGDADADPDEGVVSALVDELQEESASDEELAALRRALGVRTASDDVRIEHLQARVGEFAAYAAELGTVIDEHGDAETFVGRFEDRIDGLRADLDAVESELEALREEMDDRHGRNAEAVERLERRLEAVESLPEEFAAVFEDLDESD